MLNIHPDSNQRWILMSLLISGLLITYAGPAITKAIITELPAEWLAIEALVTSLSGLLIGVAWQGKIRRTAIKKFAILAISECAVGFLLAMYLCFVHYNVWVFAITSLIYTNIISIFVAKCVMTFKSRLWVEKEREIYDNNSSIVSGIVCVVGYTTALVAMPCLKTALFLWGLCCIFDDIGWIIVYKKNQKLLKEIQ